MIYLYKKTNVNYEVSGEGNSLLVFLHGWGANLNLIKPLAKNIPGNYTYLLIDFPPFGESAEPKDAWILEDYVNLSKQIIEKTLLENKDIKNVTILGHSFGGRVAIKLTENIKTEKLVLISAAGLKPRFSFKTKFKILLYKFLKKIGSKSAKNFGSADYKVLSDIMKQTFNKIISENLAQNCKKITAKTLIIFGNKDNETPLYMGKKFNKLIAGSRLEIIKGGDHFFYLKKLNQTVSIILNFLHFE